MANERLRGEPARVTLTSAFPTKSPRDALVLLLDGVSTLRDWMEWADDYRLTGCLLSCEDRVELAAFGGMRKVDILDGRQPREFA